MKKIILLLVVSAVIFTMIGCSDNEIVPENTQKPAKTQEPDELVTEYEKEYYTPDYDTKSTLNVEAFTEILQNDGYINDGEVMTNYNVIGDKFVNITPESISSKVSNVGVFYDKNRCFIQVDDAVYDFSTFGGYHYQLWMWDYDNNGVEDIISYQSGGSGAPMLFVRIFDLSMKKQIDVYKTTFNNFDFKYVKGKVYIDNKELTYNGTEFSCEGFKELSYGKTKLETTPN